jgi:hypothetical protein
MREIREDAIKEAAGGKKNDY